MHMFGPWQPNGRRTLSIDLDDHPGRNEQILLLSGRLEVRTADGACVLDTDGMRILEIDPGVSHALHNRWDSPTVAIR